MSNALENNLYYIPIYIMVLALLVFVLLPVSSSKERIASVIIITIAIASLAIPLNIYSTGPIKVYTINLTTEQQCDLHKLIDENRSLRNVLVITNYEDYTGYTIYKLELSSRIHDEGSARSALKRLDIKQFTSLKKTRQFICEELVDGQHIFTFNQNCLECN